MQQTQVSVYRTIGPLVCFLMQRLNSCCRVSWANLVFLSHTKMYNNEKYYQIAKANSNLTSSFPSYTGTQTSSQHGHHIVHESPGQNVRDAIEEFLPLRPGTRDGLPPRRESNPGP